MLLMPYGELRGIAAGSEVVATGRPLDVPVGDGPARARGRRLRPAARRQARRTAAGALSAASPSRAIRSRAPRIDHVLETGVRAIDTLLTLGRGQRIGIFAGSGVGKSTLLGMIARAHGRRRQRDRADRRARPRGARVRRSATSAREGLRALGGGRRDLRPAGAGRAPRRARRHGRSPSTSATSGRDVAADRWTRSRASPMAQREIGLAVGEPPTARGYTPSVFAAAAAAARARPAPPRARAPSPRFYTVLVEGDDLNDPIADSMRAILDGHIVLSRELANHGHYPAIDLAAQLQPAARRTSCTPRGARAGEAGGRDAQRARRRTVIWSRSAPTGRARTASSTARSG